MAMGENMSTGQKYAQLFCFGLGIAFIVTLILYFWWMAHLEWINATWAWLHGWVEFSIIAVALYFLCRLSLKVYHEERSKWLDRVEHAHAIHNSNRQVDLEILRVEKEYELKILSLYHQVIPGGHTYVYPANAGDRAIIHAPHMGIAQKMVEAPAQVPALEVGPVLTFRELLANGSVQAALNQGKLMFGYVNGDMRYGTWLDMYSCGIGGVSRSGKTTTVRFLLFQAVLAGAKLIMIDPHINNEDESLAAKFRCMTSVHLMEPCGEEPEKMARRIKYMKKECMKRIKSGKKGDVPLILVVDELNAAIRRMDDDIKKDFVDLLLAIEQEGSKFGIFAMLIGQRWADNDLGGGGDGARIRGLLQSKFGHRFTDEDQAKKFMNNKKGPLLLEQKKGHALFSNADGEFTQMVIPNTTNEDGARVYQMLLEKSVVSYPETTPETAETTEKFVVSQPQIEGIPPILIPQFRAKTTIETGSETTKMDIGDLADRIVTHFIQGTTDKKIIIRDVLGANPGGSEMWKQASAMYDAALKLIAERNVQNGR